MHEFSAFVKKEFSHIVRDRWTMIILLALPVVMMVLFGYAITTEVRNIGMYVFDPVRGARDTEMVAELSSSEYFVMKGYLSSPDEIDRVFREGRGQLVVVFGADGAQLVADGSDPNTAVTLVQYAQNALARFGSGPLPTRIVPEVKLLYNPQMKGAYSTVPGVMGMILMLICAMMTSISIAREKEKGTMEVLLVSPVRPLTIIIAKTVPYLALSCVNLATILAFSAFVIGIPIRGSLSLLLFVSLVFIAVSLAIGLLISSVAETQLAALLASGMGLMMPVILLSGMIFPIENMPVVLSVLSNVIPARWYIAAVRKIMIMGLGPASVARELTVLVSMAVALGALSLRKFKIRLE
jgi:ABC-2 type transport system permease protein